MALINVPIILWNIQKHFLKKRKIIVLTGTSQMMLLHFEPKKENLCSSPPSISTQAGQASTSIANHLIVYFPKIQEAIKIERTFSRLQHYMCLRFALGINLVKNKFLLLLEWSVWRCM